MSRESILKIKETEENAERILEDARTRAREMIAEAECRGREHCRKTEEETAAELSAMLEQLRERTAQMSVRIEAEGQEAAEELKKNVSLRRKIAEKIIIRGVEAKCR